MTKAVFLSFCPKEFYEGFDCIAKRREDRNKCDEPGDNANNGDSLFLLFFNSYYTILIFYISVKNLEVKNTEPIMNLNNEVTY